MPEVEAVGWADIEVAVAHFAERVAVARELLNVELELCGRSLAVNLLAGTSLSATPCRGKLDKIGGAQGPWRKRRCQCPPRVGNSTSRLVTVTSKLIQED